jgi:hypothetical protein
MELTEEQRDFADKVKKLHTLHPKLDILMCEVLLRTPPEKLDELYEQYKNDYPQGEDIFKGHYEDQYFTRPDGVIVPVVSIEHFDSDPHINTSLNNDLVNLEIIKE